MSDAAKNLAKALSDLDKLLVGVESGDDEDGDVWARLRAIQERAAAAFQGMTGRTLEHAAGRRN